MAITGAAAMKLYFPPPPKWEFTLSPTWEYRFTAYAAPCWFFRLTQRWILGIRWRRIAR